MKKGEDKRTPIVPIGLIICLLGFTFFVAMHFISASENIADDNPHNTQAQNPEISQPVSVPDAEQTETDGQFYESPNDSQNVPEFPQSESDITLGELTASVPPPMIPEFTTYRQQLTGVDYVTVEMDESDIHTGPLILVNHDVFYDIPGNLGLVSISANRTSSYRVNSTSQRLQSLIMPHLNDMMDAFLEETGKDYMYIISAYRDFGTQRSVYNQYINQPGRAAKAGHSEHHTGLAIDFATIINGVQYPFDNYPIAKNWYSGNSYRFGFIHRYPGNKTTITKVISEPWHYRYIGLPHSYITKENGWVLEEYIDKIREYTLEQPLTVEYEDELYEVFFTDSTTITVPSHAQYDISGNNVDGFIVTIYNRYDRLTNVSIE